jgi:hypothetical protein
MSSLNQIQQSAKTKVSVAPTNWLPGSFSACLPFFSVPDQRTGKLYFRADDPNIYGVSLQGVQQSPSVQKNNVVKPSNKGCNFFSAPWCIPNYPARDVGKRIYITDVDSSIFSYISALYTLVGQGTNPPTMVNLTNWRVEQPGYVKLYQLIQGSSFVNVNGTIYFGGQTQQNTTINGVSELTEVGQNLISNDFTYNGPSVSAYQMPYNTFFAVDTPIVISATDTLNSSVPRLYFTLFNSVNVLGNLTYPN